MAREMPTMYLLTEYTGRTAKDDSTHMIGRFQVSNRNFYLIIAFFTAATFLAAITAMLIEAIAILWYPAVFLFGFYLANARDSDGLRQRKWRSIKDRRSSHENEYLMGDEVIEVGASDYDSVVRLDVDLQVAATRARTSRQILEMAQ